MNTALGVGPLALVVPAVFLSCARDERLPYGAFILLRLCVEYPESHALAPKEDGVPRAAPYPTRAER